MKCGISLVLSSLIFYSNQSRRISAVSEAHHNLEARRVHPIYSIWQLQMKAVQYELPDEAHEVKSIREGGMRIVTMLFITLLTGAAGVGAWIVLKDKAPNILQSKSTKPEKQKRERAKWREAPYVILVPAQTLPEKQSAVSPPPRQPAKPKVAVAPAAPSPAPQQAPIPIAEKVPPKAPQPIAPPPVATTSSIAQQALETVIGPKKTSEKPAKDKKKLQLPYQANANSRTETFEKKQSLLSRGQIRFRRAIPLSSGTLKSGTMTITLAGLDALVADAKCKYASGKSWECGRWGKYALRRLIRGRSISCDVIEQVTENNVTARCTVAEIDINQWIVRRGWGRPLDGESEKYDVALKTAKDKKLGQWSNESGP